MSVTPYIDFEHPIIKAIVNHILKIVHDHDINIGWINITDKQPIVGQAVLFCNVGEEFSPTNFGYYYGKTHDRNSFIAHCGKNCKATHWMKLPDAPI